MGVERRVLRHRCSKKGGCVERTEGSGSSKRAQPRKGAPSPACGSVCVPAKGRHLSLSTFWQIWHLPHPRGGSATSYAYKILFWINFCSSPTRLSVFEMCNPSALPQFLYSYHFSSTLSIFAFLFFIASFEALFLSRFSLHSLTKSHANRSTCVCMCARVLQKRVCVMWMWMWWCVGGKTKQPRVSFMTRSGSAGPCTRTAWEWELRFRQNRHVV